MQQLKYMYKQYNKYIWPTFFINHDRCYPLFGGTGTWVFTEVNIFQLHIAYNNVDNEYMCTKASFRLNKPSDYSLCELFLCWLYSNVIYMKRLVAMHTCTSHPTQICHIYTEFKKNLYQNNDSLTKLTLNRPPCDFSSSADRLQSTVDTSHLCSGSMLQAE